jgi:hypothetical protein
MPMCGWVGVMACNRFLAAALAAADRGWSVFPLATAGKTPAVREWEERATTDRRQIYRWWTADVTKNVGVAVGKSGLVVVDLDDGRGDLPPERFAGARNGRDVLAMLAAEAGAGMPTDTYTVTTPRGCHLYFRVREGLVLRNTAGSVGWRVDTRAHGGYVVGAGSRREEGYYQLTRPGPVAELPDWLASALTPTPVTLPTSAVTLSGARAGAYVRAIVEGEAHGVATARTGTRHHTLLKAARTLGRLIGGGELTEAEARDALFDAAARHIGVEGCTADEVAQTINDGIAFGQQLPRRIARDRVDAATPNPGRPRSVGRERSSNPGTAPPTQTT